MSKSDNNSENNSSAQMSVIFVYDKRAIIVTDRVTVGRSVTGDYYETFLAKKLRPEMLKHGVPYSYRTISHNARPHIGAIRRSF